MKLYDLLDVNTISPSMVTDSMKPYAEWLSNFYVIRKLTINNGGIQEIIYVYVDKDGNVYLDEKDLIYGSMKG